MSFHLTARSKVNLLKRAGLYIRKATGAFLLRVMNKIIDFWSPQRYLITRLKHPPEVFYQRLNGIKTRFFFFGTHVKNYYMYHPNNNYYYFCKSFISVTNLSVGPRNMIKAWKCMRFKKLDEWQEALLPNTDNFFIFFIGFESSRIYKTVADK